MLTLLLVYFLRGLGDPKTPMRINLLDNALNIVGNYALIFGHFGAPRLGVRGTAISTTVAEWVVLVPLMVLFQGLTFWGRVKSWRWQELSLLHPEARLSERV